MLYLHIYTYICIISVFVCMYIFIDNIYKFTVLSCRIISFLLRLRNRWTNYYQLRSLMNFVFYKNFQQPRSFPGLVFVDHSVSLSLYFHYDLKSFKYLSGAGFAENSKLTFLKRHIEARFCTSQQNSSYVNWSNTVQSKPKSLYSFASSNKRDECKICDQFSAFTLKLRLIANESAY